MFNVTYYNILQDLLQKLYIFNRLNLKLILILLQQKKLAENSELILKILLKSK